MKLKIFLIMGLLSLLGFGGATAQAKEDMRKESVFPLKREIDFDSLRASYGNLPVYYVEFSSRECNYDIRVNDFIVTKTMSDDNTGGTIIPINTNILKSGKQQFDIRLFPHTNKKSKGSDVRFTFKIGFQDIKEEQSGKSAEYHWIYELPPLKIEDEIFTEYHAEGVFEANVPYNITPVWTNCKNLKDIPDIENKAKEFFNRIRKMMIDRDYESLRKEYSAKYHNIAVMSYQTNTEFEENFLDLYKWMEKGSKDDFLVIDQSSIPVYYCNKRLISLELIKDEEWFCSALGWLKEVGDYLDIATFELYVGIKEGSQELTIIL